MRYHPNPNVVFTALDDLESVLLHLKTKQYYSLNETGTLIWQHVSTGDSIDGIADALCDAYEIQPEAAKEHVLGFLQSLAGDGLVDVE